MTHMIEIDNLRLSYSRRFNLSIDALHIEEGTIFSLIGPNGAGKSTLLNIMALFQKPDAGRITVFGEDILSLRNPLSFRRSISFVLSRPLLLDRSVFENVCLPLKLRGRRNNHEVEEALDFFSIRNLMNHKALSLSQGEMYKVSLARAFVTKPRLLLLDEPFLSLDRTYKNALMIELRNVIKSLGITTIFVTQDQSESLHFADNMAVMYEGRIVQCGTPRDIFARPVSKEVADFVGMETVIDGVVTKKSGGLCSVQVNDMVLKVVSDYDENDSVSVCIRHEDVALSGEFESEIDGNVFKARIVSIEPWKLDYKVHLDCGFRFHTIVNRRKIDKLSLKEGTNVLLSFKETAPHLIGR